MPDVARIGTPRTVCRISTNPRVFTFRSPRDPPVHRWDDPLSIFGVMYTSETAVGALVETLGDLRKSSAVLAALAALTIDDGDVSLRDTRYPSGFVDRRHLDSLWLGSAEFRSASIADVTRSHSVAHLSKVFASTLAATGTKDLGSGMIQARYRHLTQAISRYLYQALPPIDGIRCPSYYGSDIINWSFFDGPHGMLETRAHVDKIEIDRPERSAIEAACATLDLTIVEE